MVFQHNNSTVFVALEFFSSFSHIQASLYTKEFDFNFIFCYILYKFNTWLYFRQAMDLGVVMEEIIGVLFWKIKDMILKKNFGKFSQTELKTFASRLSYLLPEARKAGRDAESAFEQFLLEAF